MVILQEAPHSAQGGEVLDLDGSEMIHRDARARIELVVRVQNGARLGRRRGRVRNRLPIDEQLQIVGPRRAGAGG